MTGKDGLYVTGVFVLKEEAVTPFCERLQDLLKDTRAFQGCRDIKVIRHIDRANEFLFLEEWDSNEDYQAYLDWRRSTGVTMGDTLKEPQRFERWRGQVA